DPLLEQVSAQFSANASAVDVSDAPGELSPPLEQCPERSQSRNVLHRPGRNDRELRGPKRAQIDPLELFGIKRLARLLDELVKRPPAVFDNGVRFLRRRDERLELFRVETGEGCGLKRGCHFDGIQCEGT